MYLVLSESGERISIQLFTISMDTFEIIFYFWRIAKVILISPLKRDTFHPGKGWLMVFLSFEFIFLI